MERTAELARKAINGPVASADIYKAICIDAAEGLRVDMASFWLFRNGLEAIECGCRYDRTNQTFSADEYVERSMAREYFDFILQENCIMVRDVMQAPAVANLRDTYFAPRGIKSLLDYVVFKDMLPVAVLCCEHRHSHRDWNDKDVAYLRKLTTLTGFHFSLDDN